MTTFSTPDHLSDDLEPLVGGPVLSGDDPRIAAELTAFNTTHTPRPAVVVGATCAADVAAAVRWATTRGLPVAVQSTGHGLMSDLAGTVVVSTRRMSSVTVDPVTRTARVGAGVRWAQVIEAAAPFGLARSTARRATWASSATRSVVGWGRWPGATASPPTTSGEPSSSRPTARSARSTPRATRSCSGRCAGARATSGS